MSTHDNLTTDELVSVLRREQQQSWQSGQQTPVEVYFARHPTLMNDPDSALDLIFSEFCVREDLGLTPDHAGYVDRFPQFAKELRTLFELHQAVISDDLEFSELVSDQDAERQPGESTHVELGQRLQSGELTRDDKPEPLAEPPSEATITQIDDDETLIQTDPIPDVGPISVVDPSTIAQRNVSDRSAPTQQRSDYTIGPKIGEGGMGTVYKAQQSSLSRPVALKIVRRDQVTQEARKNFVAEAVITGLLEHPNIIPIYDLAETAKKELFYSMKEVRGMPWTRSIDEATIEQNLEILMKVADAIGFAHSKGIIHRDLKPDNVMIGEFGEVLVMDWGLAAPISGFEILGIPGVIGPGGTPSYMSPEMFSGPWKSVGVASDIYLLGGLLFRMVTGKPPHVRSASGIESVLRLVQENTIQWPDESNAGHVDLLNITRRALATSPADRFASVPEFQTALREYRHHSESRRLTDSALDELAKAESSLDYRSFERVLATLEEALLLWSENQRAKEHLAKTQITYAQIALTRGDFDLAEGQLSEDDETHTELLATIRTARSERDAQVGRIRKLKNLAISLAAVVFLTISVAAVFIESARRNEVVAKSEAVEWLNESQLAIEEVSNLANALRDYPLAQEERKQLLLAVTAYYERQAAKVSDVPELRLAQLRSLVKAGHVYLQLADFDSAQTTFEETLRLSQDAKSNNAPAQLLEMQARIGLATAKANSMPDVAKNELINVVRDLKKLASATSTASRNSINLELAYASFQLGITEKTIGVDYLSALSHFEEAVRYFAAAAGEDASVGSANAMSMISQVHQITGDYTQAAKSIAAAIKLWESMLEDSKNRVQFLDGLAKSRIDQANVLRLAGHDATESYKSTVDVSKRLVELRPGIPRYRFNLGSAQLGLAWSLNRNGKTEDAREMAFDTVDTFVFLGDPSYQDIKFSYGGATAWTLLAEIQRDRGEFELADGMIDRALRILKSDLIPAESPEKIKRTAEVLMIDGQLLSRLGNHNASIESYKWVIDKITALAVESKLSSEMDTIAWAQFFLAQEFIALGKTDEASEVIDSAIASRKQMPERAVWLENHAWLLLYSPIESKRDADTAIALMQKATQLAEQNPRFQRTLSLALLRAERSDDASESLRRSRKLATSEHPEQLFLEAVLAGQKNQALGAGLPTPTQAQGHFSAACKLMDSVAPANPRLLLIRSETTDRLEIQDPVRQDMPDTEPSEEK